MVLREERLGMGEISVAYGRGSGYAGAGLTDPGWLEG